MMCFFSAEFSSGDVKTDYSQEKTETQVRSLNYFMHNNTDDHDDSEEEDITKIDEETDDKLSQDNRIMKLPNPLAEISHAKCSTSSDNSSVFVTSYHKAEEAKHSVLEQHVKMTIAQQSKDTKNKRICWNFRKGKCRFGNKCKYSHDNDIPESILNSGDQVEERQPATAMSTPGYTANYGPNSYQARSIGQDVGEDDDSYMASVKRKKRAGIGNSLVPPKKAMSALMQQRESERPWTMKQ